MSLRAVIALSGGGLDLLDEPLGAEHGGEFGLEDFDGDLAVVLQVGGQVDGSHPTGPQLALDPVAVGEGVTGARSHSLRA